MKFRFIRIKIFPLKGPFSCKKVYSSLTFFFIIHCPCIKDFSFVDGFISLHIIYVSFY